MAPSPPLFLLPLLARRYRLSNLVFLIRHFFCVAGLLGTLAAGIQSGIGNVAAGSLFATAQATAMGAGVPALAQAVGGAVTGVVGLAVAALV